MTRTCRLSWLILALLSVLVVTPALSDTYYAYSQAGIPPGAEIYNWCDTTPCDLSESIVCATPEGGTSQRMNTNVWGGWGVFLLAGTEDLTSFETGDLRFFVKSAYDLKVEFQCRPDTANVSYTTYIEQHGWDGTNTWQEIVIPLSSFFAPDPVDPACLANVYSPFLATIENLPFFSSFQIDYVRWQTANVHPGASSVEVQGRQLMVDGEPFVVNAMAYAPVGIGDNWQSGWRDREDRYSVDFPLMAASGANTVRLYAPVTSKLMLDTAWAEGLRVIPTFEVDAVQLECADGKAYMQDRFVEMVQQWKDHPAILFWLVGNDITALLTDIDSVRVLAAALLPLVVAMPLVSVWCFLFDGVYIGATAAASMMVTMGIAFVIYLFLLEPMTQQWGLHGLWGAVLVFMAVRGLAQAIWYPRLERKLSYERIHSRNIF